MYPLFRSKFKPNSANEIHRGYYKQNLSISCNLVKKLVFFASLPQYIEMPENEFGRMRQRTRTTFDRTDWSLVSFPLVRTAARLKPKKLNNCLENGTVLVISNIGKPSLAI
jgi:hypothetical protein